MKIVNHHTIDETKLNDRSVVIDLGCRGFEFAAYCAGFGAKVFAIDADPAIVDPRIQGVEYINAAIVQDSYQGATVPLYRDEGDEGFNIIKGTDAKSIIVPALRFSALIDMARAVSDDKEIELIKLDIEGAEYRILNEYNFQLSRPARQLSIEFHDFVGKCPTDPETYHSRLKSRLAANYNVERYIRTPTPWPPHDMHYVDVWVGPLV